MHPNCSRCRLPHAECQCRWPVSTTPSITSRISRDGNWHVWIVFVDGIARRKGWTPAGREDAAREAAKDVRELTAIERAREVSDDQMWSPTATQIRSALRKPVVESEVES